MNPNNLSEKTMRKVKFSRDNQTLYDFELMELQGKLEARPDQQQRKSDHFIGTLSRNGNRAEIIIEKKKLIGKTVDLRRPLLLVKKTGENKYQVRSVLKKKLLFRRRPTPWEVSGLAQASPSTPMTPTPASDFIHPSPAKPRIRDAPQLVSGPFLKGKNAPTLRQEMTSPGKLRTKPKKKRRPPSIFDKWVKKKK